MESCSVFSVMEHADQYLALSRSAKTLMEFAGLINELTLLLDTVPLDKFVNQVLDLSGYRQMIKNLGPEEADRLDNLDEFISNVVEYMKSTDSPTLTEFLEETALVADVDRYDDTADAVAIALCHAQSSGSAMGQYFNKRT